MPELELAAKTADEELAKELAAIPNLPLDDVPEGADEHGNVQRHLYGKIRNYAFTPKPHDDLGGALGYMDFEAAAKVIGRALRGAEKGTGAARARDRSVHARSPYQASTATPRSIRRYWCATT
jgi:seryl-tRNA synthetase